MLKEQFLLGVIQGRTEGAPKMEEKTNNHKNVKSQTIQGEAPQQGVQKPKLRLLLRECGTETHVSKYSREHCQTSVWEPCTALQVTQQSDAGAQVQLPLITSDC